MVRSPLNTALVEVQRNVGIRRMGIELPPLNTDLVEVHRELARVTMGVKDMATKSKNVWKAELRTTHERIAELERDITTMQQQPPTDSANV